MTRSANMAIAISVPFLDDEKVVVFVDNMYARYHIMEIELVAW